jgi:type VI secretion system protein ImpA
MPSPPVLEIEALLAPIPGDEPAGSGVPLPVREELDQARKEIDPNDFDEQDPMRPTEAKRADWPRIVSICQEILAESSKDLMIVARLTEALVKVHGFAGLRDGLSLFHRLVDEAWDRVRPVIEEPDDLEARATAFNWLDDPDRGSRFPTTVRVIPILSTGKMDLSWMAWNLSRKTKGGPTPEEFDQLINAAPRAACALVFEDLEETVAIFQQLCEQLNARMGQLAPGLTSLRQAVFECRTLAKQILDRKGPEPDSETSGEGATEGSAEEGGGGGGGGGGISVSRVMQSRAQVYARLAEAAELLGQLEPHSPIPYLIRRAVQLGDLSFPDLVKALISDSSVRADLGRSLGIDELRDY